MAALLGGRDHKHLVREFLSPMVHEGLLAYTIPEMENHPDQRYTVPADITESGESTL
jgi:ATP-dependent DNA helicase RecG